ncbi:MULTISPECIES: hypothetical protein [Streptomyces diastaticus group]|uniref:Uncharacterized protein n=2 Tax=Streptomyces TaxID=1883 RepID=A0A8H9LSP7_9ACTN|nr:hypothetical protein [Streptomyces gougerotii]GFH78121.1 hypothetical protein Sgou_27910 [Streptomyces gougerotii]GGU80480.1 hypothetical protein GCM10010227_38530 [Streptomyces gougerotii]
MTADEARLEAKATGFAETLTALTRGVLGPDSPRFSAGYSGTRVLVAPLDEDGMTATSIPVAIDQVPCLQLHIQHFCCWDTAGQYLATDRADVKVFFESSLEPLLRHEYVRKGKNPPGAHLQVHAHRDELAYLLRLAERKQSSPSGKSRRGKPPRVSEIRFPVGGHRFRPGLEDVLLLLEREFAIDVEPGWRKIIEAETGKWRQSRLRAAVRDAPDVAAAVLRDLGYAVDPPQGDGLPAPRSSGMDSRLYWP